MTVRRKWRESGCGRREFPPHNGAGGRNIAGSSKKRMLIAVAVLAALIAFGAIRFRGSQFAWDVFWQAMAGVRWAWLAVAVGFLYVSYWGRALRWRAMLAPLRPGASTLLLTEATIIGFTAVVLLGRPGELVRPYLIANKAKVSFSSQMAAWLLERIFDLLMVLAVFGFALAVVPASKLHLGAGLRFVFRAGGYVSAGIGLLCLALLFGLRRFSGTTAGRLQEALGFLPPSFQSRIQSVTKSFAEGMGATLSTGLLGVIAGYSVLVWTVILAAMYAIFRALPSTSGLSLLQTAVFLGLVSFGAAVQIPGIGGGVQVASVLVLTEIFGFRLETASAVAILLWVVAYLPVVPAGLLLAAKEGIGWRITRQIEEDVVA